MAALWEKRAPPKVTMTLWVAMIKKKKKDSKPSQVKIRQDSFPFFKVDDILLTHEPRSELVPSNEMSGKMRWFTKIRTYKAGPLDRDFLMEIPVLAQRAKSLLYTSLLKPCSRL